MSDDEVNSGDDVDMEETENDEEPEDLDAKIAAVKEQVRSLLSVSCKVEKQDLALLSGKSLEKGFHVYLESWLYYNKCQFPHI